jgi:hypothetical protein
MQDKKSEIEKRYSVETKEKQGSFVKKLRLFREAETVTAATHGLDSRDV